MTPVVRRALHATALAAAACSLREPPPAIAPSHPVRITILGVNDFHGALDERKVLVATSGGSFAELRVGGAALLYAYVQKLRALDPEGTIALSAGDMWQGSMESNLFEGRPVVMLDNEIGYDAAALGNHEFDYGPSGPVSLAGRADPPDERFGALLDRIKEARFPILSANARPVEAGAPSFQPWVTIRRRGLKVALVGLSTEDTPNTTQAANVAGLAFDPPATALVKASEEARARGAVLVIAVAHLGGRCRPGSDPRDESACAADEEVARVLRDLPPRTVDAFVAGHTHQTIAHYISGVPVIESGAYGLALGRIELDVDPATGTVLRSSVFPPQPICRDVLVETQSCFPLPDGPAPRPSVAPASFLGGPIVPDARIDRMLAPFRQEVLGVKSEVIGVAARTLGLSRSEASDAGSFIADEMRAATRRLPDVPDADFALQNSGGIRAPIAAGPITYGALYETLPFDNVLSTIALTGLEIERLLTAVARTGRVFQSSGLYVEIHGAGLTAQARAFDLATRKPLDPKRRYVVVWNDFLAAGGDGVREALATAPAPEIHPSHRLRDVVADGLRARGGRPIHSEEEPALDPRRPRLKVVGRRLP